MTTRKRVAVRPETSSRDNSSLETQPEVEAQEVQEVETHEAEPVTAAAPSATFASLELHSELLAVLNQKNFTIPTPIQLKSIPVAMNGEDIIGIAQTGTGKTLAFGLPILNQFIKNGKRSRGRALIILPTRELALQVEESLQNIGKSFGLRTAVLIGGAPMRPQQSQLRANPDIIVATPGRLIDHLQQRGVDLRSVDTLVLDEADRMLDMGFAPQIKQILREVPEERQTMLFSATMPDAIVQIANNYMRQPTRIEVARAGTTAEDVTQELFIVAQDGKNEVLSRLLYDYTGTVLVFTRTRSRAARVARFIKNAGHNSAEIHSDRTLVQRRAALDGFKAGRYRVLVATDIAARGIDVNDIELVLNYDLPDSAEDYVHRIGRTARAGKSGHAISFAAPDQSQMMREIERLIESPIEVSQHSPEVFERGSGSSSRGRRGGPSRGGGGSRPSGNRPSEHRSGESRPPRSEGASHAPRPFNSLRSGNRSFSGGKGGFARNNRTSRAS
jgi:ATP-dependent RNA helicase RhlE